MPTSGEFPSVSTCVPLQVVETPRRKNGGAVIGNPEQSLEKETAPRDRQSRAVIGEGNGAPLQCSCLENPMDEEPGGLQSMGLLRFAHD